MKQHTFEKISEWIVLGLFLALMIGTPLVFTPITRSVFEVNKLLLLRVVTLFTLFFWAFRAILYKDNGADPALYKWMKLRLEWPIGIWLVLNLLSTIFSQNLYVAIIGAYDRWEGILTIFNYMFLLLMVAQLITKRYQVRILFWAILGSTALSAFYGVIQSLGYDIMSWSKDPQQRVFACINNPVHFCAYVAMTVPMGIAMLLKRTKKTVGALTETFTRSKRSLQLHFGFSAALLLLINPIFFDGFINLSFYIFVLLSLAATYLCINTVFRVPSRLDLMKWSGFCSALILLFTLDWLPFNTDQWFAYFIFLGLQFIVAPLPQKDIAIKRSLFVFTLIIYYSQILSFSRATWVGFNIMMPLFYLFITSFFVERDSKTFTKHMLFAGIASIIFTANFIFNLSSYGVIPLLFVTAILLGFLAYSLHLFRAETQTKDTLFQDGLALASGLACSYLIFSDSITALFSPILAIIVTLGIMGVFLGVCYTSSASVKRVLEAVIVMMIFATIQFTAVSIIQILIYFSLAGGYYIVGLKGKAISKEYKFWLLAFLSSFGLIMILTTLPSLISKLAFMIQNKSSIQVLIMGFGATTYTLYNLLLYRDFKPLKSKRGLIKLGCTAVVIIGVLFPVKSFLGRHSSMGILSNQLVAMNSLTDRVTSYSESSKKNPRVSMWKSAVPWFKDFPLLGTGPDTIKFMYPKYRRPEYGRLEGGHNFTPDRLHNEYINTLVTRGLPATIVYYLGLILGWFYIMTQGLYRARKSPESAPVAALCAGVGIYLGQVFFNFGVVATLVLFYVLMGIGLAVVKRPGLLLEEEADDHV